MKWLVVCLGNPGLRYQKTRHNLGWMVANHLLQSLPSTKLNVHHVDNLYSCEVGSTDFQLLMPGQFVNNSGKSVVDALRDLDSCSSEFIVIHDDIDLKLGTIRIKHEGSAGGHNGVKSIISAVKSDKFARIRLGVGRPPRNVDPADFVLEPFLESELLIANRMIDSASQAVCKMAVHEWEQLAPEFLLAEN